jgi:hypothetical protein
MCFARAKKTQQKRAGLFQPGVTDFTENEKLVFFSSEPGRNREKT